MVFGDGWPVAIIGLIYFYIYFTHDERERNKEIDREKQLKQWEEERSKKESKRNETIIKRDIKVKSAYSTAIEKNNSCELCGSKINLQQHHILPIQHGGTDDESNLTTLCKTCHEKEHGYDFTEDNFSKDRKPLGKSEIVSKAIREKKNLKIKYSSPDFKSKPQETTIRIITPIELYKAEYRTRSGVDGYRVTVRAFCHLRKSERNFQIRRIKEIELLM